MTERQKVWKGMNWIRQSTRLAIYLRDGLACCWCSETIEDGAQLTLDHCLPHVHGGSKKPENLITSCKRCNSARGTRSMRAFAVAVGIYLDWTPNMIMTHIRRCRRRQLPRAEARELIRRRGSALLAVQAETRRH